ncbi:CHASE2 domain-containing protein [Hyphococcus sp.]|uniref:CHASE2 domain-containing protein n=1 Tax=Hyphococcus sp. TaxID=2038636 RepID=UPI003CCC405F
MKNLRSIFGPRIAGVIGATLALVIVFQQPMLVNVARDRLFDQFQRISPRAYDSDLVKVVEIDDAALEKYGQWPWPRHRFATIVDNLNEAGAAAIVFDILFAEPDRTSPGNVSASWLDAPLLVPIVSELDASNLDELDHDSRFAAAIEAAPTVMHITARSGASTAVCPPVLEAARVQGVRPSDLARVAPSFRQIVPPLPIFRDAARGEGFARAALNDDAIIRTVPLIALACDGKEIYPSLVLEALRVAAPKLNPTLAPTDFVQEAVERPCKAHVTSTATQSVSQVALCSLRFPTSQDGQLWIHYSRLESIEKRRLSVVDVLEGETVSLSEIVKGRIVMIGASAEGLRDALITPLGDVRPGVHIHAEVVEQALSEETLYRAWDLMRPAEIGAAILVTLIMLLFLPRLSAAMGFSIWLILTAAFFAGAFCAFHFGRLLIDPVTPNLIIATSFFGSFVVMFQQEQIARKFIRGAFGKFLSPLIVERLERDPTLLKLEGQSREITAFFSDIRGFTSISEQMSPPEVTTLLNQYFTQMTRIVVNHKGLVDKFMGDGLAAMWNAPVDVTNHPAQAARASLQMLKSLEKLNAVWRENDQLPVPEIKIGIGLHTAEARVGNFGSEDHLEYSMLGDMVNLTSRLESLTKLYGAPIIMSKQTRECIPDFAGVLLGASTVVGRTDSTIIYALVGDDTVAAKLAFQSFRRSFEMGVVALENADAHAALDHFGACEQGETFGLEETIKSFKRRAEDMIRST